MQLKVKFLKWHAGIPVAMLNEKAAEKIGVHAGDRISIKLFSRKSPEFLTIIDTIEDFIKDNEISVSCEIRKRLKLKKGQKVDINIAELPASLDFIKKKLNNKTLSKKEILEIIEDVVNNSLSEAEIALFVGAMYKNGMTFKETVYLIEAILKSGKKLNLKNKFVVDKHCVGGVPGNRTTPIVVAICAAAGLTIPKSSSRAITSAAGTTDVIETIAKVEFSLKELKKIIQKTNACMVWGGSLDLVPADSKIIKVEKMLKIDPEAQLLASIFSKKLAIGGNGCAVKCILIDIPYGKTAKVTKSKALKLKKDFEKLGKHFKRNLKVILTRGEEPIGNGIGPALELMDIIKILDPKKQGPKDLEEKSLFLAGELLEMSKKTPKGNGILCAREILYSGKAFKKFKEIIKAQKGKLNGLTLGKYKKDIIAKKPAIIKEIDNKKINSLARVAGCPIDKFSGLYLYKHVGERLKKREKLLTIYAQSKPRLREAIKFYKKEKPIKLS